MTAINDDKRAQLLRDGFCKFEGVLAPETVAALGAASDRMLDALPPEQAQKLRAQGSLLHTTGDPIFADLITDPAALQALASLGFEHPSFSDGYVISKPATARACSGTTTGSRGKTTTATGRPRRSFLPCTI